VSISFLYLLGGKESGLVVSPSAFNGIITCGVALEDGEKSAPCLSPDHEIEGQTIPTA